MSNILEINIAKELDIKELSVVVKRIEKYKIELEESLTGKQKMILNNLLHNKSRVTAIIALYCISKNNKINEGDLTQSQTDVKSLLSCMEVE